MGEDRIVFGSDGVWYGSPQWQIEAFWGFQIPDELCRKYGYPKLTESTRRKILGQNSAKLYKLPPAAAPAPHGPYKPVPADYESQIPASLKTILEFPGFTADNISKMKETYLAADGERSNMRYGWLRTRA